MDGKSMVDPLADSMAPVVYFVGAWDVGRVKIGATTAGRLAYRVGEIMQASPVELKLLGYQPGGFDLERSLHERFAAYNVGGEWFEMAPDVVQYIDEYAIRKWGCRRPVMLWLARKPGGKQRRWVPATVRRPSVPPKSMDDPQPEPDGPGEPDGHSCSVEVRLTPRQIEVLTGEFARLKGKENAPIEDVLEWMVAQRISKAEKASRAATTRS